MNLLKQRGLFLIYGLFISLIFVFIYFNLKLTPSPLVLTLAFLFILLLPGFSLSRIFKIKFSEDTFGQIILYLALGLLTAFILSFSGIILKLTIDILSQIYLGTIFLLFIAALVFDLIRPHEKPKALKIDWKSIVSANNLIALLFIIFVVFILIGIGWTGGLFKGGDPAFHLAIIRKAFDGQPLSSQNLALIKTTKIHIAYGIPVWHVFLAVFAKISHIDMLVLWKYIIMPLTIITLAIWYWFLRQIFPSRALAWLALIFFTISNVNWQIGYLFQCLAIPDTFNTLLLLPLTLALALKFIFNKEFSYKLLIILTLISIFMADIHVPQYFYFLMIMVLLLVLYLLLHIKSKEYKQTLFRILWIFGANLIIITPLLIIFELKNRLISATLKASLKATSFQALRYGSFNRFNTYAKVAYILSPLVLIFSARYRKLTFILALFLVVPIAYSKLVKIGLLKLLGYIFLNRLYGSISWHFIIWGFVLGLIILLIDRLVFKSEKVSKYLRYFVDLLFLVGGVSAIFIEKKYKFATFVYNKIFSTQFDSWLDKNYILLISILGGISILLFLWQRIQAKKIIKYFKIDELKNYLVGPAIIFVISLILISPGYRPLSDNIKKSFSKNQLFTSANFDPKDIIKYAGGKPLVNYVNENIPPKSVFLVPGSYIYNFPVFVDQFMPAYPRTADLKKYNKIYRDYTDDTKLHILADSSIDYVLLTAHEYQIVEGFFLRYPEYFEKIYQKDIYIYKVNLKEIRRDRPVPDNASEDETTSESTEVVSD